jgi:2-hydroxychromene-2-carboxylate isomerase
MTVQVLSFTIYHSVNAYIGTHLLRSGLADLDGVELVRRPIYVPRGAGVTVAEMLGGRENRNMAGYNREDCARWAERYDLPLIFPRPGVFEERARRWEISAFEREELPARAFYAAPPERQQALDEALFRAAWAEGLDVNQHDTIRLAAQWAGLDGEELLAALHAEEVGLAVRRALQEFMAAACPGVPTVVVAGERFFGKDRADWVLERVRSLRAATEG